MFQALSLLHLFLSPPLQLWMSLEPSENSSLRLTSENAIYRCRVFDASWQSHVCSLWCLFLRFLFDNFDPPFIVLMHHFCLLFFFVLWSTAIKQWLVLP